jgi:tetratricopeptide (TPR) repeat protein
MQCSNCSHLNPGEARFCVSCGTALAISCPACRQPLPSGARYCSQCGSSVEPGAGPTSSVAATSAEALLSPDSFVSGRYEVKRFLGEGGKKKVYLVHDTMLDRDVAFSLIKTEGLDEVGIMRIKQEAQLMGRLGDHPHVVSLYDIGDEGGQPYLVSQLMGGGDVEGLIEKAAEHRLALVDTLRIADQICQALHYAHSHGIVHRDLKPGNVWLTRDGTAKLGDFGLAMALDKTRLSVAGMIVGTLAYMPPEQALGRQPDARSDLYSLGAMLYEMTTGRPPFLGNDPVAVIGQHINTQPVAPSWHNPRIPPALEALILRLLEKDPTRRPQDATTVRQELAAIEADVVTTSVDQKTSTEEELNPLDRLAGGVFVGREKELTTLRSAVTEAFSGRGQIVLVVGEPGIGKTRLAEQIATYAGLHGAQILRGRSDDWEGAPAYWPWVQVIRDYVHDRDPQALRSDLGPGAVDIAQIVSDVHERLPDLPPPPAMEPEQARFQLFDGIVRFLQTASKRQPIVLILDDLHWADQPSLLLLEFLAREPRGARLLVIGTYRDVEVGRRHPLSRTLAELARSQRSQRLLLRGLPRPDVARFIALTAGIDPAAELVDAVHRETEGNPFFVTEVVRLLIAEGRLERAAVEQSWSVSIPESVRDVVGRRLERLSETSNRMLTIAAVVGRDFSLPVLEHTSGLSTADLLDVLEEAVEARLIQEETPVGQYRFTHALVQETLYDELSTASRTRLHAQIGEALEQIHAGNSDPHVTELAHHFTQAVPALSAEKAIDYGVRAGQRAMKQLAWEEAVKHFDRALQLFDLTESRDEQQRTDLLLALGAAQIQAGAGEEAKTTLRQAIESAREGGNPERVAEATLLFVIGSVGVNEVDDERIQLLEAALEGLGQRDSMLRVQVLSRLAVALYYVPGSYERRKVLCNEAVDTARQLGDPMVLADALGIRQRALWGPDNLEERLAGLAECLRLAAVHRDEDETFWWQSWRSVYGWRWWLFHSLVEQGDLTAADRQLTIFEQLTSQSRVPLDQYLLLQLRSMRALMTGRYAQAEEIATQALPIGQRGIYTQGPHQLHVRKLAALRREQGRLAEVTDLLTGLIERNPQVPHWRFHLAWLYAGDGRYPEASDLIEELAAHNFTDLPRDNYWIVSLALLAEACWILGATRHTDLLYELLHPYETQHVVPGPHAIYHGSVTHYLGLLATTLSRWDEAESHFEDALATHTRIEAPPFAARTQYAYADMLERRGEAGDEERALELIGQTLGTAEKLGMTRLAEQAIALKVRVQGILKA